VMGLSIDGANLGGATMTQAPTALN